MAYLAESNIVHSDLAARNILVTTGDNGKASKYLAKIGDLRLRKVIHEGKNYYTTDNKTIWVFLLQYSLHVLQASLLVHCYEDTCS